MAPPTLLGGHGRGPGCPGVGSRGSAHARYSPPAARSSPHQLRTLAVVTSASAPGPEGAQDVQPDHRLIALARVVGRLPERPVLTVPEVFAAADAIGPRCRPLVLLTAFTTLLRAQAEPQDGRAAGWAVATEQLPGRLGQGP